MRDRFDGVGIGGIRVAGGRVCASGKLAGDCHRTLTTSCGGIALSVGVAVAVAVKAPRIARPRRHAAIEGQVKAMAPRSAPEPIPVVPEHVLCAGGGYAGPRSQQRRMCRPP